MTEIVSKQTWLERFGKASLEELCKGALEYGHKLQAKSRADALDECYELYAGKAKPIAPTADAPVVRPLGFEARAAGHGINSRCRAGYTLTRFWALLSPTPTAEQIETLRADPFVQVRIAE